jgi:hypothetical protein
LKKRISSLRIIYYFINKCLLTLEYIRGIVCNILCKSRDNNTKQLEKCVQIPFCSLWIRFHWISCVDWVSSFAFVFTLAACYAWYNKHSHSPCKKSNLFLSYVLAGWNDKYSYWYVLSWLYTSWLSEVNGVKVDTQASKTASKDVTNVWSWYLSEVLPREPLL